MRGREEVSLTKALNVFFWVGIWKIPEEEEYRKLIWVGNKIGFD